MHGGGSYVVRSDALAAANPFSVATHYRDGVVTNALVKPQDLLQQFGGRVGGALGRNNFLGARWTGFASGEAVVREFPAVSSPGFSYVAPSFYALTATQMALLGNRGVTRAATNVALNYLDGLTGEVPRSSTRAVWLGRLEARVGERDSVGR